MGALRTHAFLSIQIRSFLCNCRHNLASSDAGSLFWEIVDSPLRTQAGEDPGFAVGGGADPRGGGANIRIGQIFPKLHEMKNILVRGGAGGAPLGSATEKEGLFCTFPSKSIWKLIHVLRAQFSTTTNDAEYFFLTQKKPKI